MEMIEFLQHTNHRNLKCNIKSMVKDRLRSIHEDLNERRLLLRCNLECENLRYSEELALVMKNRIEDAARKREQWFGIQRIQREHDKDKFLQLKALQREMENCEATRHWQSKALLLDTKEAQLHQIKEKEAMRQREKQLELIWEDVTRRYFEEKAKQDVVETKLLKTIAGINQNINIKNYECQRKNNKVAEQATREQFEKEHMFHTLMNGSHLARRRVAERNKKLSQQKELTEQITENQIIRWKNKKLLFDEEVKIMENCNSEILNNQQEEEKRKIQDSVWQECYINHVKEEKERKREESKQFDLKFSGTGCVLKQQNKKPYNKSAR
ncbi:trichohyalin isoform X1 [Bactrocera neohumeralis]|uniref:trichohyalin isoform X1 n=1 Tax=Bactrocera neohumeralis TaxID=98809 RepID=UPI0021658163|nr:trichohyalin isoform X1 [Bactrocera neohumeralis]